MKSLKASLFTALFFLSLVSCNSKKDNDKTKNINNIKDSISSVKKDTGIVGQTLFKDYKFGQNIDEFKKSGKYEDCSDFFEQPALCIEGVSFLDNEYSAGLIFKNNQLEKVILYTEYSDEVYSTLPASLEKNNFQLVLLEDDKERLDILQLSKKQTRENFLQTITTFENRMLSGSDGLIAFLENKNLKKDIQQYASAAELVLDMPESGREIDLRIINGDDGKRYLSLCFALVKNELKGLGKKESF
jgi:hypothetical protein